MKVLIADTDRDYVSMLVRSLRQSEYKDRLTISVVTGLDEIFGEEQAALQRYDAVILAPEYYERLIDLPLEAVVIIVWSESRVVCEEEDVLRIYKYQPINRLMGDAIRLIERSSGKTILKSASESDCRVIAIYSASGGIGKTTISLGLSGLLSATGYRVFYLNMEGNPSQLYSPNREWPRFCRILYHLKKEEPAEIRSLWFKDPERGVTTFSPPEHDGEWSEYTRDDMKTLFSRLRESGQFDCIVADLDSGISDRTMGAIESSDNLLWLDRADAIGANKARFALKAIMDQLPDPEFLNHICQRVTVRVSEKPPDPSIFSHYMKLLGLEVKLSLE